MAEAKQDKVLSNVFNKKLKNWIDSSLVQSTSQNDNAYVTGYDKIIIPQFSGAIPQVDITGATDWNAQTLSTVTHTSNEYSINTRKFGAVLVTVLDEEELLYDKAAQIMDQMQIDIEKYLVEYTMYKWTTTKAGNLVPTTGTARLNRIGTTVKAMTYADFTAANQILDEQLIPAEGRVFVGNSRMIRDIKNMSEWDNSDVRTTEIMTTGYVGMLDGVKIYQRETNNVFAIGGAALQPFETAPVITDLFYGMIYHPAFVRSAIGTNATSGGAQFIVRYPSGVAGKPALEAYVRVGASRSYLDGATTSTGIVTIVETV